jgi:signal transduction histidine kinase
MEDLLLWSKGQMERFEPRNTQFLVREIFEDTQRYFASEKIKIKFKNDQNLEAFTDKDYLKTIIRNLTGNALKALSETSNPSIVWTAFEQDEQVVFSITDNGPGADQSEFKALYDENEIVGVKSGLGLHLIRDLAKVINCEITVNSKSNLGTTFTLKFI